MNKSIFLKSISLEEHGVILNKLNPNASLVPGFFAIIERKRYSLGEIRTIEEWISISKL